MVDILYVSDRMSGFFVYTYHVVQQKMREECQESRGEGRRVMRRIDILHVTV